MATASRYDRLIEHVFFQHHSAKATRVEFARDDLTRAATATGPSFIAT